MKKTLLVTLDYPPMIGGVAHYYHNLISCLPDGQVYVLDDEHHELLSTSRFVWPRWMKGMVSTWRSVRMYNIEHILVGQILPIGTIALILHLFKRIPYTVMTHAMDVTLPQGSGGNRRKRWLVRMILRKAHRVTTVSSYTRQQLEKLGVPAKKIIMVYPCPNVDGAIDIANEATVGNLNEKYELGTKKLILSVGRLVERKGFDMVIQAFARLREESPDLVYAVVGDGPDMNRLKKLADQLDVSDRVIFTGRVEEEELAQWYSRATVVCMPSRQLSNYDVEGFGIVFLEANSYGKPVIGGKSGGVGDAVVDGETGFLVEPDDVRMLAAALERLLSDSQLAQQLGENGRRRVAERFRWEVQAKELEHILSL